MESNEQGGRSRWLHVELVLRHDQDQPSTREERYDTREVRGGGRREAGGWRLRGERQMQVQPAPVQDGRTDVRADEGGIELWQRLLQGAGSGPGEADILLILYFFVCEGPAVGTVGHASPSVQLRSGLLFGIVARPHRHHGPSRSHLSHRPGWNRRFHPP